MNNVAFTPKKPEVVAAPPAANGHAASEKEPVVESAPEPEAVTETAVPAPKEIEVVAEKSDAPKVSCDSSAGVLSC